MHDTNCWVTSRAHSSPRHRLMNSQADPLSAAQPLTKMLICRAGYNLLLGRRGSIFINQKSPHSVLLPAVQILCPRVLSIPSPAVPWTLYLAMPCINTPSPQPQHLCSQSPNLRNYNCFLGKENRKRSKDRRFHLKFAYSNFSSQQFTLQKRATRKGRVEVGSCTLGDLLQIPQGARGRLASARFSFATQDSNTFNCAKAKLSGAQI